MADLTRVRTWAEALIRLHLDPSWTFAFDNAKTRAGACHWSGKKITVSRYLAARWEDDEVHQVLLHEVAHAMSGHAAGHGEVWRVTAARLGYVGGRTHSSEVADELAPWVGTCPGGHVYFRHRRPTRSLACGRCGRGFDRANLIEWRHREISASTRRAALSPERAASPEGATSPERAASPDGATRARASAGVGAGSTPSDDPVDSRARRTSVDDRVALEGIAASDSSSRTGAGGSSVPAADLEGRPAAAGRPSRRAPRGTARRGGPPAGGPVRQHDDHLEALIDAAEEEWAYRFGRDGQSSGK